MLTYLILEPARKRYPGLGWLRFWQLLHDRTNGLADDSYRRLTSLWRAPVALPASQHMSGSQIDATLVDLRRDGCAVLPFRLANEDITALKAFAFETPAYAADRKKDVSLSEDAIPLDYLRYAWRTRDVIGNAVVQRLVLEGPFNAIAQDYLGARPKLATIALWLNPAFPGLNDMNIYHYDNDGPGFLKFFLYLTDMGIGTGAHYFIKGTHARRKPVQFAKSKRYSEEQLFAHYARAQQFVAEGPAGTVLAEDTMGFHRGSNLERGYRLMLQLQYSIIDIPTEEDVEREYVPVVVPNLDARTELITGKYFKAA
jgi:hypothetical protein